MDGSCARIAAEWVTFTTADCGCRSGREASDPKAAERRAPTDGQMAADAVGYEQTHGMTWTQTITVSGLAQDRPYLLHCEPEGAEHEVLPGDVLKLTFTASEPHDFELSCSDGRLVLCRLGDSEVSITDKRGRSLRW